MGVGISQFGIFLVADYDSPLNTLPFIRDALCCMGAFLQNEPELPDSPGAEVGAGLIVCFLAYAVDDVLAVLRERYRVVRK